MRYINPITVDDFPDPCVIQVEGSGYYAYGTHDEFSPSINNILIKHSWDLIEWSESKGALLYPPTWAEHSNKFWCPHVVKVENKFRLYYATEPDSKDGMCLALALSDSPFDFVDCGEPISKLSGSTYQMIDPCFFIDPISNKHLLYYGSAHEPIRVVEVGSDGKSFLTNPTAVLYPGEGTFHKLREGAFVTYNSTWKRYFLWVSGDNTWAENSYAVSAYWSSDPQGIFNEIPGDPIIIKHNKIFDSPGHNCIIQDALGDEWIFYHAVEINNRYIDGTDRFLRKMCIDRIMYSSDGWPYILNGSPSYTEQSGPVLNDVSNYP